MRDLRGCTFWPFYLPNRSPFVPHTPILYMGKLRPTKGNDLRPPNEKMTGVPTPDLVNSRPLLQSLIAQSPQNKRNQSAPVSQGGENGSGRKVAIATDKPQDEARNHHSPLPASPSNTSEYSMPHVLEQKHHRREGGRN